MAEWKSSTSPPEPEKQAAISRRYLRALKYLLVGGLLFGGVWFVWVDYQIRTDFKQLQWALPARIYARPLELYVGAHISASEFTDTLQRLGYRQSSQINGPGEYRQADSHIQLWSRGFEFWDGVEPGMYIDAGFNGRAIDSLRGQDSRDLPLLRLEPVEIAQINPDTGEDRLLVSLSQVPPALVNAIIAVEDQRFYSHYGIDPIGIARAMRSNLRQGALVEGGSTLTQQLVKNLYLTRERTLRRKAEEALMALSLEFHFSKNEILAAYFNEVFLGQDGDRAIHGFALGAQYYFGRPLSELKLDELALLAALPRGASFYNPMRYPERATERRNIVLARMLDQGFISNAEFEEASNATLVTRTRPVNRSGYPAFMELVYRDLERDYDSEALRSEGLRIFTTLDVSMQNTLEATLDNSVKAVERTGAGKTPLEAAVVLTSATTGEVLAVAGSRKSGYTGFNRALHAVRPIGSLVKPAVYLAALESEDFQLASILSDEEVTITMQDGQIWQPKNYDLNTDGPVYLYAALQRSLNLATVDLGMKIGVDKVYNMLGRLGFERKIQPYPSLLLGAVDMSPLEVAQIYQTLAANGFRSPLRAVEAVTTGQGEPLARYGIATEQAADPAAVFLLEHALQGVFDRGTAKMVYDRVLPNLPLAGKTGTTNDLRDSWFAGYGDDLVGVVWLGYDDNRATELTGATGALLVWTDLMTRFDIQPRQTASPTDIVWNTVPRDPVSNPALRDCSATRQLPFRQNTIPDVAWNCAVSDSFFERVLNRVRNL